MARRTDSIAVETLDADSKWSVGGEIKSDDWTPDDLTVLRAYEWDRINFSDPKKLKKTADRMGISVEELNKIRKRTIKNAIKAINTRNSKKGIKVTVAADIIKVTSQKTGLKDAAIKA